MALYHIEYLIGRIDNQELVSKVQKFEKHYDEEKQAYPIASQIQLKSLLSFIKESKPGYFIARMTTMFQLLQDYRSFTVGQLEFRRSLVGKRKMVNILKRLPTLLSKSAILKRMSNTNHFSYNKTEKKINNTDLDLNEMFQLSQKLESKNMAKYCRILRNLYPKLFESDKYNEWSMNTSNTIKLILNYEGISQDKKNEMIAKYLGAIYNTDRYVRYTTNYSESKMKTMGPYFTDSLYSYQIDNVKKIKIESNHLPAISSKLQNDIDYLEKFKKLGQQTLNIPISSGSIKNEKIKTARENFNNPSQKTIFVGKCGSQQNNSSNLFSFAIEESRVECDKLLNDPKLDKFISNPKSLSQSNFFDSIQFIHLRSTGWTKKDVEDINYQISLTHMLQQKENYLSLFEGDEIKILENIISQMNSIYRYDQKFLEIILTNQKTNIHMKSTSDMTRTLFVNINARKMISAELNGENLDLPIWSILHKIYLWYMGDKMSTKQYVDESTTKDLYLRLFVKDFETHHAKVK